MLNIFKHRNQDTKRVEKVAVQSLNSVALEKAPAANDRHYDNSIDKNRRHLRSRLRTPVSTVGGWRVSTW